MSEFRTVTRTAPNGFQYEVQVSSERSHPTVEDGPGMGQRAVWATEDKAERATGDKAAEAPVKRGPGRPRKERPGAVSRRPVSE